MARNSDELPFLLEDHQIIIILYGWIRSFFSEQFLGDDTLHAELLNALTQIAYHYTDCNPFIRQSVQKILTESKEVFDKCLN